MIDTIADTLARIKNAVQREKKNVKILNTNMNRAIVQILKQEMFVNEFSVEGEEIDVELKYIDDEPVIVEVERISKPGQRIYVTKQEILPVMNGRGISVISTSKGVMTGAQAKSQSLGGEFICKVW